jgi:hypothetical protein
VGNREKINTAGIAETVEEPFSMHAKREIVQYVLKAETAP